MEVPVRRILMGASPDAVLNRNAMADPRTLDSFVAYAAKQRDYSLQPAVRSATQATAGD